MATRTDLQTVADSIRKVLADLVKAHPTSRAEVFESQPGNLRAIVVSDFFDGMGLSQRQERIWAHLKAKLSDDCLSRLYGVHPYDAREYVDVSPISSTTPPRTGVRGLSGDPEDHENQ